MYNLMRALDIEDNIEGLRYDKVILATDADVDGLHIRNPDDHLLLPLFEQVVHHGHLYVLQTPLFRVRLLHVSFALSFVWPFHSHYADGRNPENAQ